MKTKGDDLGKARTIYSQPNNPFNVPVVTGLRVWCAILFSCSSAVVVWAESMHKVREEIDAANRAYVEGMRTRDAQGLAKLYTKAVVPMKPARNGIGPMMARQSSYALRGGSG
jgi:hypothetical protein